MTISGDQSRLFDPALDDLPQEQNSAVAPLYRELSADSPSLQQEMARAYKPIVMGFLAPAMVYYALITVAHYSIEEGTAAHMLGLLSAATAGLSLFFRQVWLRDNDSLGRLEFVNATVNALIYANITVYLSIHFEPSKLIYFVLLILVIAASSVTSRVIIAGCAISLATMLWFAWEAGHEIFMQFAFIGLAGGFAALGMAWLMRGAILRAVTARHATEELRHKAQIQADYDALTGMPNRRRFFAELDQLMARADAEPQTFHLGIVDLDGFRPVNDLYGHSVGDALLMEVAIRLVRVCPSTYLTARLGGDEFAILVRKDMDEAELGRLGQSITEAMAAPFYIGRIAVNVTASVGFAAWPGDGRCVQQVYERADHALNCAKRGNGGDVVIFNDTHQAELTNISRVDQALRNSDLDKELFVMFQPQVDVQKGRAVSFEALARWHSPTLGMVPPSDFIAAAERSGLIGRMTAILLRKALAAMATWPDDISLSFNLSARDLASPRTIDAVSRIVTDSGIAPERLIFEITETSVMSDPARARAALEYLADMGCRISLDDFGSGYSNFGYINRFPLHQLKIDRSFVTRLSEGAVAHNIIKAIVELCRNLDLECLVEGVETKEELEAVVSAGARIVQGYHFSRPLQSLAVLDYLQGQQAAEALQKRA